jgi:hypothetical protein
MSTPPEHNVTGIDYAQRDHLTYRGPIIDFHAHVMVTRPGEPKEGPPIGEGPGASLDQAELMLRVGADFGVVQTMSMCLPGDIEPLREKLDGRIAFNGPISKKALVDADETAYELLDRYLGLGIKAIKLWSAPRGVDRGLFVDAPWRIECVKRARAAGVRLVMVHVADPDRWFRTTYADVAKYGTKPDQYVRLERMLDLFRDMTWIGAHMGGDPEHPDHLESLLERYPHFNIDTSATKWQVREVSPRNGAIRALVCRYPDRFLFGTDLVTRHHLTAEHYVSRYWCQRTLWESTWEGRSPIADPDYTAEPNGPTTPLLRGVGLPPDVLDKVYYGNAKRLLGLGNA